MSVTAEDGKGRSGRSLSGMFHRSTQGSSSEDDSSAAEHIYEKIDKQFATLESHYAMADEIYDVLCTYRDPRQEPVRRTTDKAQNAVNELLDKEESYLFLLKRIRDGFYQPLTHYLSQSQRYALFANLLELIDVHSKFYDDLTDACLGADVRAAAESEDGGCGVPAASLRKIGEAVTRRAPEFAAAYAVYLEKMDSAVDELKKILQSEAPVRYQIERCEVGQPDGHCQLEQRIQFPPQRYLKMHCMFTAILQGIGESHPEYAGLKSSFEVLKKVNDYLDAVYWESVENLKGLIVKENIAYGNMGDNEEALLIKYRLLYKGDLLTTIKDSPTRIRSVFILGDVLLMCDKGKAGVFQCTRALSLANKFVDSQPGHSTWSLVDKFSHEGISFRCQKKNAGEKEREEWVRAAERGIALAQTLAMPSFVRRRGHWFLGTDCGPGAACNACQDFLEGIAGRGMECMMCKVRTHGTCLDVLDADCPLPEPRTLKCSQTLPTDVGNRIRTKIWFEETLSDREEVRKRLSHPSIPSGTFFARYSKGTQRVVFSVKDGKDVKHLRLVTVAYRAEGNRSMIAFCLTDSMGFDSVEDLVTWCQSNVLPINESDEVRLTVPYRLVPNKPSGADGGDVHLGDSTYVGFPRDARSGSLVSTASRSRLHSSEQRRMAYKTDSTTRRNSTAH